MEILENLGRRVVKKRGSKGLRATAKEIGISHATLARVEDGNMPDLENYKKIARWLGVEVDGEAQNRNRSNDSGVARVHFRKSKTTSPDTAKALAELILAAQKALVSAGR